jgi:hypothetical protein
MVRRRFVPILLGVLILAGSPAEAAKWSRAYIRQLPDSAFAAIETAPDGRTLRHLPHHDAAGNLDLPHLRSALSRLHQVKWQDPATAESAHQHLLDHLRQQQPVGLHPPTKGAR